MRKGTMHRAPTISFLAVMAAVVSLCDEDPVRVARPVAIDNGLSADFIMVKGWF